MALLQISEPGQSPDPHQRRIAVGIDLGTTHSLVAAVKSGVAECLPDAQGRLLLPSVVRYLQGGGRQIGYEAVLAQAQDARNTVASAKRFMGRALADIAGADKLPYDFVQESGQGGMVSLATADGVKSPVEVSAEILATLRQRAEDSFDADLYGAVITVPAYFDDAQRQATKDAARLAGIHLLRLINEPTAAAIAYGLDNASEGVYAVYDLGGGTFDISILRLTQGVFEVIATGGDSALGGDDYDAALADWVLQRLGRSADTPADKAAARSEGRALLARLLRQVLGQVSPTARLVVNTKEGCAVCFVGDPEDALRTAVQLGDAAAAEGLGVHMASTWARCGSRPTRGPTDARASSATASPSPSASCASRSPGRC